MIGSFNIALRPASSSLARQTIALAEGFTGQADGYLLGRDAWPHITLCQFRTNEHANWPEKIWSDLGHLSFDIRFDGYYMHEGRKNHDGYQWVGLQVKRDPELLAFQRRIHALLESYRLELGTATGEDYFPHLTFARLGKNADKISFARLPHDLALNRHSFYVTIGAGGPNGTYQSQLLPSPAL